MDRQIEFSKSKPNVEKDVCDFMLMLLRNDYAAVLHQDDCCYIVEFEYEDYLGFGNEIPRWITEDEWLEIWDKRKNSKEEAEDNRKIVENPLNDVPDSMEDEDYVASDDEWIDDENCKWKTTKTPLDNIPNDVIEQLRDSFPSVFTYQKNTEDTLTIGTPTTTGVPTIQLSTEEMVKFFEKNS